MSWTESLKSSSKTDPESVVKEIRDTCAILLLRNFREGNRDCDLETAVKKVTKKVTEKFDEKEDPRITVEDCDSETAVKKPEQHGDSETAIKKPKRDGKLESSVRGVTTKIRND